MELVRKDIVRVQKGVHSYLTSKKPTRQRHPILLLHGAGGGAWYWERFINFLTSFGGYRCYAPDLPGHGARARERILTTGVEGYVEAMVDFIVAVILPAHGGLLPIIVGHSMGGLIAQKLAERGYAHKLVLLAPAPPKGIHLKFREDFVIPWTDRLRGMRSMVTGAPITPSSAMLRTLFIDPEKSKDMIERCKNYKLYESPVALLDLVRSRIPINRSEVTVPMLIIGFTQDHIIAERVVRLVGQFYGAEEVKENKNLHRELEIRPDLGHLCPLEYGWEKIARRCLAWIG